MSDLGLWSHARLHLRRPPARIERELQSQPLRCLSLPAFAAEGTTAGNALADLGDFRLRLGQVAQAQPIRGPFNRPVVQPSASAGGLTLRKTAPFPILCL